MPQSERGMDVEWRPCDRMKRNPSAANPGRSVPACTAVRLCETNRDFLYIYYRDDTRDYIYI